MNARMRRSSTRASGASGVRILELRDSFKSKSSEDFCINAVDLS